ncbi:MAG TPA: hypothetical protein VM901_05825 [Bdellovibrionota bacterium]|jgi:hypothetical protein|nr:hypothetical protein [Bdellovibrionota bacterium]
MKILSKIVLSVSFVFGATSAMAAKLEKRNQVAFGGGFVDKETVSPGAGNEYVFTDAKGRYNSMAFHYKVNFCQSSGPSSKSERCMEQRLPEQWQNDHHHALNLPLEGQRLAVFYTTYQAQLMVFDLDQLTAKSSDSEALAAAAKKLVLRDQGADACPNGVDAKSVKLAELKLVEKNLYGVINLECSAAYGREYQLLVKFDENLAFDETYTRAFAMRMPGRESGGESYQDLRGLALSDTANEYLVRNGYSASGDRHHFRLANLQDHSVRAEFSLPSSFYSTWSGDFHDYSTYVDTGLYWVVNADDQLAIVPKRSPADLKIVKLSDSVNGQIAISPTEMLLWDLRQNGSDLKTNFIKVDLTTGNQTERLTHGLVQIKGWMGIGIKTGTEAPILLKGHALFLMTDSDSNVAVGNLELLSLNLVDMGIAGRTKAIAAESPQADVYKTRMDFFKVGEGVNARIALSVARHLRYSKAFTPKTLFFTDTATIDTELAEYVEPLHFVDSNRFVGAGLKPDQGDTNGRLSRWLYELVAD